MGSNANSSVSPNPWDPRTFVLPNCTNILPYSEMFFEAISTQELIGISVCGVLVVAILLIYLDGVCYVRKHYILKKTRHPTLWILALHPVFAVTSIIAVCIPRASLISDLVATIYLSMCLRVFLILLIHYHGGEEALIQRMEYINLRNRPLCCCCCCCPKIRLTQKNLKRIKLCVWQVAFLRPILVFMATVMWTDGKYTKGKTKANEAYVYLSSVTIVSTLVAMYGLHLVYQASRKHLRKLHIIPKFISIQLVLIFSNIQGIIFTVLAGYQLPVCRGILSSNTRGEALNHLILIGEMFLLALLARYFYRRSDGALTLAEVSTDSQSSDDKSPKAGSLCCNRKKETYSVCNKDNEESIQHIS